MEVKKHNIKIEELTSDIELIKGLRSLIYNEYHMLFHAVIVHGSVGTNEIIPYSDFDGLLIVKDEHVNSSDLKKFKKESMKLILKFDPLQHHGWFEIKVGDLDNYPESYLPVSTLKHSKLLFPKVPKIELNLKLKENVDYKPTLVNMINQFEKREIQGWRPNNIYQLKSILSQIMLIPCLYFSAIHNDGIFKRESFQAVRSNFTENEWMPIKTATNIRTHWTYRMNYLQNELFVQPNRFIRKIATRYLAPKIPLHMQQEFSDEFYDNLMLMVKKIKKDIT